ncbi:hypothetical protein OBBRIDRAFT_829379 [Obba rivulosa]|uniref:Uncharacterized protein n=1 Tax=Obba rivulosa TaxID=1052685 RepID=A0A8E2DF60_9APHY|nr:hypothetical protein OBBRIDRAFT_829379 [Obba rivulosa]
MDALKAQLHLTDDQVDEDISVTLTSLITTAVRDRHAEHTLQRISDAVVNTNVVSSLEPLSVLPILLPCSDDGAERILRVIGEQGSAKETVMALQEAVESLERNLEADEDPEEQLADNILSPSKQLDRVMQLYAAAIPRLPRRNKLPHEVMEPLLSDLESIIPWSMQDAESEDARLLVSSTAHLARGLTNWIRSDPSHVTEVQTQSTDILYNVLTTAAQSFAARVRGNLAQAAFQEQFSGLIVPRDTLPGPSDDSSNPMNDVWDALRALSLSTGTCETRPSLGSLVLLAHAPSYTMPLPTLTSFAPIVVSSIQSNTALDETLSLLLRALAPLRTHAPAPAPSPTLLAPLAHVLPPLASAHPDPATRHHAFRLLALVLHLAPSLLRLELLHGLLTDSAAPPQMRVAAVGLVKEAVLEALAGSSQDVFVSPLFLGTLGPVLFRTDPPDLLSGSGLLLEEFLESSEPLRLVESLGLFYLLLKRDVRNRTGIRDSATSVQLSLLKPLREQLERWKNEPNEENTDHDHATMQLGILEMWVDRASEAIAELA